MRVKKSPSIKDVARLAGISAGCVSKYLCKKPYVSKNTRKKIEQSILQLNYKPNLVARSLVSKKTNKIGLIVFDIKNPYQTEILSGIEEYIYQKNLNYRTLFVDMSIGEETGDKYIDSLLEDRVDGILSTSDKLSRVCLSYLQDINIPIIFIGRYPDHSDMDINFVTVDNYMGAYLLIRYLMDQGHRNIGYISGPLDTLVTQNRLKGYKAALSDSGIDIREENIIIEKEFNPESGKEGAKKLFLLKNKPSAIFCSNDFAAYGVIDFCYKKNLKIPEDVSIAGFDDIGFSSMDFVNLTTVRQPIKEMVAIATGELIKKIEGKDINITINKVLTPEIIIRESTAPGKKSIC